MAPLVAVLALVLQAGAPPGDSAPAPPDLTSGLASGPTSGRTSGPASGPPSGPPAALSLPSGAQGQGQGAAAPGPSARALTAAGAEAPPPPPASLPGVTVRGRRGPCAARDQACIRSVIQEIWTRFPDKIETWCTAQETRRFRDNITLEAIGSDPGTLEHGLRPEEKALCDYGAVARAAARSKKRQDEAKTPPAAPAPPAP